MARETILLAYDLIIKSYTCPRDIESTIYPSHQQAFESKYLPNQNTNSFQLEEPLGLGSTDLEAQRWNSRMASPNRYGTCNLCAEITPEIIQCQALKKAVQVLTEEADLTRTKMKEVSEEVNHLKSCLLNIDKKIENNNCQKQISRSRSSGIRSIVPLKEGTRQTRQIIRSRSPGIRSIEPLKEDTRQTRQSPAMRRRSVDKKIENNDCQKQISRSRSPGIRPIVPLKEATRQIHQSPAMLCENKLTPKILTGKERSNAIGLKIHEKREYPRTGLKTQQGITSKIAGKKSSEDKIQRSARAVFVPEETRRNESSTTTALTTRVGCTSNVFLLAPKALKREISAVKVGKPTHPRLKHTSDVLKVDVQTDKTLPDERHISPMSSLAFEELFSILDANNHVYVTPSQVRRSMVRIKSKKIKSVAIGKTPLLIHPISRNPSTESSISRHSEKNTNPKQEVIKRAYTRPPATRVHFQKKLDSALQTRNKDTSEETETKTNHFPSEIESTKHVYSETHVLDGKTNTNLQTLNNQKACGIDYRKRLCFKKRAPGSDVPNDNVQSCLIASNINKHSSNNFTAKTTSDSKVPDSCVVEKYPGSTVSPTEREKRPLWKYTCRSRNETRSILEQINKNTVEWDELSISTTMEPNIDGSEAHSIVTEKSLKCEMDDTDTLSDLDTVNSSCTIVAMTSDEEAQRDIDCESRHESETSSTTSSRVEDIQLSEMLPLAEDVTALETLPLVVNTDVSEMLPLAEDVAETSPLVEDNYASGTLTLVENTTAFEKSTLVKNTYHSATSTLVENTFDKSPKVENTYSSGTLTLFENTNAFDTTSLDADTKVSKSLPLVVEEIIDSEAFQCVAGTKYLELQPCFKDERFAEILHRVEGTKVSETLSCIVDSRGSGRSFEQDTVTSKTTTDDTQDEYSTNTGTSLAAESFHEELDRRVSKALEKNSKRFTPDVQLFSLSYQKSSMKKRTLACSKSAEERKTSTDNTTDAPQSKKTEGKIIYVKRPCKLVHKKRSGDGNENVIQRSSMSGKSISPIEERFKSTVDLIWGRSSTVSKTLCKSHASETKKGLNDIPSMIRASNSSIIQRSSSVFRDSENRHVDAVTPKKNTIIVKKFNPTPRVIKTYRFTAEDE